MSRRMIDARKFGMKNAGRILNTEMIVRTIGQTTDDSASDIRGDRNTFRFINSMCEGGFFRRVHRGLYINYMQSPPPIPDEAAEFIRPGAILSLQRTLGAYGVANNPSDVVTAVLPIYPGPTYPGQHPKLGMVETEIGLFQFRGIPAAILFAGAEEDRLQTFNRPIPGNARCATPEKALIDWLYLAQSRFSKMSAPPPEDMDIASMNPERIDRLAVAAGIREYVRKWIMRSDFLQNHDWDHEAEAMGLNL